MIPEHVFPRYFGRELSITPDSEPVFREFFEDPLSGDIIEESRHLDDGPYGITVADVCGACNKELLNEKIENPISELLLFMAIGENMRLSSQQVMQLATWAAKTAMTRELMIRGNPSIPPDQYRWIHDHALAPQNMMVFIGKAEFTPKTFHRHRTFRASDGSGRGHFTTIVIGHLWVVIAGFSTRDLFEDGWTRVDAICSVMLRGALVQIWPFKAHEVAEDPETGYAIFTLDERDFPPGPEATADTYRRVSEGPYMPWINEIEDADIVQQAGAGDD